MEVLGHADSRREALGDLAYLRSLWLQPRQKCGEMGLQGFRLIQATLERPPTMCMPSSRGWRCVSLPFHRCPCRLHAHHLRHNGGITTEVEDAEVDVRSRSHTLCS